MCYSLESSRNSFLIGLVASLILLANTEPTKQHLGLFFLTVGLMQMLEYMMYLDLDSENQCNRGYNQLATSWVIPVLSLQLFTLFFGAYVFETSKIAPGVILSILMILTPLLIWYNYYYYVGNGCSKQIEGAMVWDVHLSRGLNLLEKFIYLGSLTLFPLTFKNQEVGLTLTLSGIALNYFNYNSDYGAWNSRWCYYSALLPLIFLLF